MSGHEVHSEPVKNKFFTPGVFVLMGLMGLAGIIIVKRYLFSLSSVTNLTDCYPWGLWIGIDVSSGVALAAGGFTTAAVAHIFHRGRYEALVRPALLTAMLGYTFVALGLLVDLGRYYNIWHPLLPPMWQGNSVLFEVAMCVTCYLTVLYLEFAPIFCERFMGRVNLPGPLAALNEKSEWALKMLNTVTGRLMPLLIIAGVVLSCMHQSSLGTLMVIAPYKMHALWYTPFMPLLFLLSAFAVGPAMVVFESMLASKSFKRKPEMEILTPFSRILGGLIGIYMVAKFIDLAARGALPTMFEGTARSSMFLVEIGFGVVLPFVMLLMKRVRSSPPMLFSAAALIVLGVALNRVNVFATAYQPPYAECQYYPSVSEYIVTIGLIATLIFVYRVIVTICPVLPKDEETDGRIKVKPNTLSR